MILQKIRSHSATHHQNLENCSMMQPLVNGSISLPQYSAILKKFYGFFSIMEKQLNGIDFTRWLSDYAERRKAKLLLEDLEILGVGEVNNFAEDVPSILNAGNAFGCLYVLEGSTLGGKIITEVLRKNLNIDLSNGASFFHGYGKETGTMWKKFLDALIKFHEQEMKEEDILEGVNSTFVSLKNWLEKDIDLHAFEKNNYE